MTSALQTFATRIAATRRIGKADVQALRRDILADGLGSRAEAEALIALDRRAVSVHATWPATLIGLVTEFAVWTARPTGVVDQDLAAWLKPLLTGETASPRGARILAEILREAHAVDESLKGLDMDMPSLPLAA